ncbi:ATP-dependent DNA helicase RecG [Chitinophaga cymbidii]|uniref:ATP-dependent DNA helicase RecG n=2 Tax=Chitinophaga cymbidii TaxID=1096750 RepID=A0A512RQM7_9BACT|nr:RNA-binding domain-containing protein [Chitinophaga cymbidii]GEP97994.1 ATP-dependent DNA helicase RecG [Chitinophaga cymbidii]
MTSDKLQQILQQGEGLEIEFKTSAFELNKDAFESVCAFLNRRGGHLLLGVNNNGGIEGVIENCIPDIIHNIVTNANNHQKLNPPFYLSPEVIDIDDRKIIHLYIPESSQVHNTNGRIFDRNDDGDFDITKHADQVAKLYLRKQTTYSENNVFPYLELADFKPALFKRIRVLAEHERAGHPWMEMSDDELLRSAGLYKKDPLTGKSGYTLAAALLLGKDETIMNVLPHYKTDAIVRISNPDRFDDRDDIRTNLVDSYDRLMSFIGKHLPDKFYQEGEHRTSLRDRLFREVISNLLIHREFTNAFPAKLIIEKDRVYAENWSRPHGAGLIDPANFAPFPKNPVIAKFFNEMGRVDELGSGVRSTFRYCSVYTPGAHPQFIEGDIFKTVIPLKNIGKTTPVKESGWPQVRRKVRRKFGEKFGESSEKILLVIFRSNGLSASAIGKEVGISSRAVEKQLARLKDLGIIKRVGPDKGGYWEISDLS